MAKKGGIRPGAGRKAIAIEQRTSEICKQAILATYGGNCEAMKALLNTGEVQLIKFVFEHAFGKPMEKNEITLPMLGLDKANEIYI